MEHHLQMSGMVTVEVPITASPLNTAQYEALTHRINPLQNSDFYGVDLYTEVLSFLNSINI